MLLIVAIPASALPCKKKYNDSFKYAFWNLENACDTLNDPGADDDFTPVGANAWNSAKYKAKLHKLAFVINQLKADVYGFSEIEKIEVLRDIFHEPELANKAFKLIEFDSPDERGIDVAFAFDSLKFDFVSSNPILVALPGDKTRDILHITLRLKSSNDTVHFFTCHFPSRRGGVEGSKDKRAFAAITLKNYLNQNKLQNKNVIVAGDFNDNPTDSSLNKVLGAVKPADNAAPNLLNLALFFNPETDRTLGGPKNGSIFDQIIITPNLWKGNSSLTFKRYSCRIFAPDWLKQNDGKFAGYPYRTYGGKTWLNGYSDHFPVCATFVFKKK